MIVNKAKFSTVIGPLHYLWTGLENDPEVIYLGTDSNSFDAYIKQLTFPILRPGKKVDNNSVIVEKRCILIEDKIIGYLEGKTKDTGLKTFFMTGTVFEKNVWDVATRIPYGQTLSYSEIARICGNPGAGRAAGNALGKNPVIIIVPCHRIIKSDGDIGGFTAGPRLKKKFLSIEGV